MSAEDSTEYNDRLVGIVAFQSYCLPDVPIEIQNSKSDERGSDEIENDRRRSHHQEEEESIPVEKPKGIDKEGQAGAWIN